MIEKQTNCHSDASFCHKTAFETRLFAKKIKFNAKKLFYLKMLPS